MTATVDITLEKCPMTWVRVKLALEALRSGEELCVLLQGDEPTRNVPQSARDEGHRVLSMQPRGDGSFQLTLQAVHPSVTAP